MGKPSETLNIILMRNIFSQQAYGEKTLLGLSGFVRGDVLTNNRKQKQQPTPTGRQR